MGFGVEGKAVLEYLMKHGYHEVTVCDQNVDVKKHMPDGVSVRLGKEYLDNLTDFEVIFRSPGIKALEPAILGAKAAGALITSSTAYFMAHRPCRVIGVTGTKGKGTTCTLIYEMLRKEGLDAYLGGNIGESAIDFLDKVKKDSVAVLELSSFQLQDLTTAPEYAVLLNTTTDHLDYHVDRDEYMQAKESILANQKKDDFAVLNKDYEYVEYYLPLVKGHLRLVSGREKVKDGCFEDDGVIYHVEDGKEKKICEVDDIALIGSHNVENVMAAISVAKDLGVSDKNIVAVVKEFKGLPHRLEFASEVLGVKYYNDSFSTTPETSMAAVDSFKEPTVLIAGGFDKKLSYDEWAVKILTRPSLEVVILVGDNADILEGDLKAAEEKLGEAEGSPTKVLKRDDLREALITASEEAKKGGVVVMSPGSSSFDLYRNYKERGQRFRDEVKRLEAKK